MYPSLDRELLLQQTICELDGGGRGVGAILGFSMLITVGVVWRTELINIIIPVNINQWLSGNNSRTPISNVRAAYTLSHISLAKQVMEHQRVMEHHKARPHDVVYTDTKTTT